MSDVAIRVEGLGKKYRLGAKQQSYGSLRESLASAADRPVRLAKRLAGRGAATSERKPEFWALKDVSFEVKHGEVLGIIGRNGAGKSTLLKLLSEITEPTTGRITMNGRVASLLEVGTGFHPELTGRENIYLNGAILGMSKAEIARKFDEIVAFAEVEQFIDTQVKHYSSGMYLRLAFAVAAHLEPEILVVDEVLAVGDSAFQQKCLGKMNAVAREGRTVFFVSHNLSAVAALTSRSLLLEKGQLRADCDTNLTIREYTSHGGDPSGSVADLRSTPTASGTGQVVITHVWFEDEHGHVLPRLLNGKSATACIRYTSRDAGSIGRLDASIAFLDGYDTYAMYHRTCFTNQEMYRAPSDGILCWEIPKVPLVHGEYALKVYLEVNGDSSYLASDAMRICVEDGDYYGTGTSGMPSHCKVLFDGTWRWRPFDNLPKGVGDLGIFV